MQGALSRLLVIKSSELNMIKLILCIWGLAKTNLHHHQNNNETKIHSVSAGLRCKPLAFHTLGNDASGYGVPRILRCRCECVCDFLRLNCHEEKWSLRKLLAFDWFGFLESGHSLTKCTLSFQTAALLNFPTVFVWSACVRVCVCVCVYIRVCGHVCTDLRRSQITTVHQFKTHRL